MYGITSLNSLTLAAGSVSFRDVVKGRPCRVYETGQRGFSGIRLPVNIAVGISRRLTLLGATGGINGLSHLRLAAGGDAGLAKRRRLTAGEREDSCRLLRPRVGFGERREDSSTRGRDRRCLGSHKSGRVILMSWHAKVTFSAIIHNRLRTSKTIRIVHIS